MSRSRSARAAGPPVRSASRAASGDGWASEAVRGAGEFMPRASPGRRRRGRPGAILWTAAPPTVPPHRCRGRRPERGLARADGAPGRQRPAGISWSSHPQGPGPGRPPVPTHAASTDNLARAPTTTGPDTSFTGAVLIDGIRGPRDGSRAAINHVHFAPGARTHSHWHPVGQTLYGTDGVGLVVTRDGEVLTLEPGRTIWIPPREEHWHGALSTSLMAHIAVQEVDEDDEAVFWMEAVGDEELARAEAVVAAG